MLKMFENVVRRVDGSFVITKDGMPYHVPNKGDFSELWARVDVYAKAHPDEVSEEPEEYQPTAEEIAQTEYSTALSESAAILTARSFRQLAQAEEFTPAEFATFAKAGLFPVWTPGAAYVAGNRIVHETVVYEVKQAVTAQAHQPPGGVGMLAVYRPISADPATGDEPDGSPENPIPYIAGMDVFSGKHYSFEDAVYLAKADMIPCHEGWKPGTAGMWQWELVG